MNFQEFGKREAIEIGLKLQECESKLFERCFHDDEVINSSENFYDDGVLFTDSHEFKSWSESFPFLRMNGTGISIPVKMNHPELSNEALDAKLFVLSSTVGQELQSSETNNGLFIQGRSISFQPNQETFASESSDEFAEDGVLEEVIAIDKSDSFTNKSSPFDPNYNLKEEIISQKIQKSLWPKIVKELEPLITSVVEVSRRKGVVYAPETRKFHESYSSTDSFEEW